MTKVEQIVLESLMSRGYSKSEAGHFVTVLKCPNDNIESVGIEERINVVFNKYITKITENEKLSTKINSLRSENLNLKEDLHDVEVVLETTVKNNNMLKRTVNTLLGSLQKEIQNARKTINDRGIFGI